MRHSWYNWALAWEIKYCTCTLHSSGPPLVLLDSRKSEEGIITQLHLRPPFLEIFIKKKKAASWNAYEHFAPGSVAVRKNHCNHHKTWQHQGHASRVLFPITVNHRLSPVYCETSNCGSLNTINKTTVPRCTWLVFVEARGKFTLLPRNRTEVADASAQLGGDKSQKRSCK